MPFSTTPTQGPFRDPREVQRQRYRPFNPTLKVATSYTSVEDARKKMKEREWVMRLNDDMYVPLVHIVVNVGACQC